MLPLFAKAGDAIRLRGPYRHEAAVRIRNGHYTHSVPSGKSYYFGYEDALVVFSIPANCNIGRFLFGRDATVWELARLWAPDAHRPNLLTEAISAAVKQLLRLEPKIEAIVSYADPNAGHTGGVYKAASWLSLGQSDESRSYRGADGTTVARRKFHSGSNSMTRAEIEQRGFTQVKLPGKLRFVRPITKRARKELRQPR